MVELPVLPGRTGVLDPEKPTGALGILSVKSPSEWLELLQRTGRKWSLVTRSDEKSLPKEHAQKREPIGSWEVKGHPQDGPGPLGEHMEEKTQSNEGFPLSSVPGPPRVAS